MGGEEQRRVGFGQSRRGGLAVTEEVLVNVADPGKRFVAFLIDAVPIFVLNILTRAINSGALAGLIGLVAFAYSIYNGIYLQGTTGQSIGKKQQGIKLVRMVSRSAC
jgi:uncharacterized RDD family membrane protein YckC